MDFRQLLMKTTKPVLSSSRSGSAASERHDGEDSASHHDSDLTFMTSLKREVEFKPAVTAMASVFNSVNKMKIIRQRSQASKGNITLDTPMRKFDSTLVGREIDRILATTLNGMTYDPKRASVLTKSLSDSIKGKVKTMKFPRYKYVAIVTISSKSDQSMFIGSKCVWNAGLDSSATGHFSNGSLIAVGTIFAMFKE